jgi:hypothetical protein
MSDQQLIPCSLHLCQLPLPTSTQGSLLLRHQGIKRSSDNCHLLQFCSVVPGVLPNDGWLRILSLLFGLLLLLLHLLFLPLLLQYPWPFGRVRCPRGGWQRLTRRARQGSSRLLLLSAACLAVFRQLLALSLAPILAMAAEVFVVAGIVLPRPSRATASSTLQSRRRLDRRCRGWAYLVSPSHDAPREGMLVLLVVLYMCFEACKGGKSESKKGGKAKNNLTCSRWPVAREINIANSLLAQS